MKALHNTQPTSGYRVNSIEILEQYPCKFTVVPFSSYKLRREDFAEVWEVDWLS